MDNLESYIKLDNDIRQRPIVFQGTHAEWEALTSTQKAHYQYIAFTEDTGSPEVVDQYPIENSTNLVQSGGIYNYIMQLEEAMAGNIEMSTIAAYPHAVGDLFVRFYNNRILYFRAIAAIAVGDTISTSTNCTWIDISHEILRRDSAIDLQTIGYKHTTENAWEACATFHVTGTKKYGFSATWSSGKPYALGIGNSSSLSYGYPNLCVFQEFDPNTYGHVGSTIWPYVPLYTEDLILYCKRLGGVGSNNYYHLWQL